MAVNPKDLTVDYRAIQAMPFKDRKALMYSSYADQVNAALTPSQRANLFPNYYAQSAAAAATSGATAGAGMSKAEYLKRARNGGVSDSDLNRVSGRPEEKGPPKITASEFHAVEGNPFLAGYADKTQRRSPGNGKVAGTEGLKGRQQTMKSVYDAFSSAGFSHKQALALTAEVGRENGFQEKYMFGTHSDPYNNATNLGMLSMQGPRLNALKEHLAADGRFDASGNLIRDQDTMNSMAKFYMNEMQTTEKSKMTEAFLANPDIDSKDAGYILGKGYIRWRYDDPRYAHHHTIRDQYYSEIDSITSTFADVADQTTPPDAMAVVQNVAGQTPMASELQSTVTEVAAVDGGKIKPVSDPISFINARNPNKADIDHVDPILLKSYSEGIQQFEADNPQYRVEVFGPNSGLRNEGSTHNHGMQSNGYGGAVDWVIIDRKTGEQLTNAAIPYPGQKGSPGETAPLYAKLHSAAALAQSYYFPESDQIAFGGGFVSGEGRTKFDLMHGDVTHEKGTLGYSWESGWTPSMLKTHNIPENVAIGSKDEQYALAQKIYGKVDAEGNYSNRLVAVKNEQDNTSRFASAEVKPTAVASEEVKPPAPTTPAAATAIQEAGAVTPNVTAAAMPPAPQSTTHPIKTMAQGGTIQKSADTQIVQRNRAGEIVSATKVGENENEKMQIEPISKMNADALTVASSNPVEDGMINSKQQSAPEDKKVSMKSQSIAQPRLSSDPYSNIYGAIKPMSPTALAAMNRARDLSSERRGYSIKNT